jgi:hypothetical protein
MRKLFFVFTLVCSQILGQNAYDVLRPFWGFEHSQILSNSIGNATVASGYITPGLTSNPANLAAIQFGYIQINFSDSEFNSGSSSITNTGFNGLDIVQPASVHRGRLVYSVGAHKKSDFMSAYDNSISRFSEKGKLTSYHIAAALEFSRNFYLGADLKFLGGNDEMVQIRDEKTYYYKPRYSGSNITIGLLHVLSKNLQYGISVDMPSSLSISEDYVESNHLDTELSFSETYQYDVKKPITFHLGAALLLKSINFFYEAEQVNWSNLEFSSDQIYEEDLELPASVTINEEIRDTFSSTLSHHFGGAIKLPKIPVNLFTGYQYIPTPFSGIFDGDVRHTYNFGVSVALQKNITLQGSYDSCSWKVGESSNNFDRISVGISLHDISGF